VRLLGNFSGVANMGYKIISCDDHLDLQQLPSDLWTMRMPRTMRDRAPRVEERDGRALWICDRRIWGSWAGRRREPGELPLKSPIVNAFDRSGMTDQSRRRPAVPELRLADMDRDGVQTHVMFGPVFSITTDDPALRDACYRAYNDWLAEFCTAAPDRLIGVPMLPEVPESALKELLRLANGGNFRQANLQIANVKPRLHDPAWEPFWSAVEETGLILSFHVVVFLGVSNDPAAGKPASIFTQTKAFIEQFLDPFVDLFAWGILERHPKMRVLMAESGLGWLPRVVQELDYRHWRLWEAREYWDQHGGIKLMMKPSDLFKRQIYVTFQEDCVAMSLLPFFGDGHVLWASDYPHPDSTWPNSRAAIERQMAALTPEMRRRLTHDNAARLYGLDF
jgi:predicted TIM-barrel fold metal-dependent hydrolase